MKLLRFSLSPALLLAAATLFCSGVWTNAVAAPKRVLVVTVNAMQEGKGTLGFHHSSIPVAEKVIGQLAEKSGAFTVDYAHVDPNDPHYKDANGKLDAIKVNDAITVVLSEKMSPAGL